MAKPVNDAVLGDLPPKSMELKPKMSEDVRFLFNADFLGITGHTRIRIVILARTKKGAMGIGLPSPRFVSAPFDIHDKLKGLIGPYDGRVAEP